MPFLFPESKALLKMFGINEAQMASDVYEQFFGKRFITPKTYENWHSGGNLRHTFMQHVEFMNVDSERKKAAEEMVKKADAIRAANKIYQGDKIPRTVLSIINLEGFAESFRELGAFYVAGVIADIVDREKQFVCGWPQAREKIVDDDLVNYLLRADEVELIRQAADDARFNVSVALLHLRTPLYAMAAMEAQYFTDFNIGVLDTSHQIADEGERAVGVFFTNLTEHLVKSGLIKNDSEFVQNYMLDVECEKGKDPEGAAVKKFCRWKKGTHIPKFYNVLAVVRKISENIEDVGRVMFLFLLAVYVRNGTKINRRLNTKWTGEYKRFLDKHMAGIKTKAG